MAALEIGIRMALEKGVAYVGIEEANKRLTARQMRHFGVGL